MAANKNQHFVPKIHFKPFSKDGENACVNLLVLSNKKLVSNAPIKNQCSKNYFYGKDLELEKAFQELEGYYGQIIAKVQTNPYDVLDDDLQFLRFFAYLQSVRTEAAVRRNSAFFTEMMSKAYAENPEFLPEYETTDEDIVRLCLSGVDAFCEHSADLRTCLILNRSKTEFITSDDPAIITNRFHAQKEFLKHLGVGISAAGAMLFMPLSPKICFVAYDQNVYSADHRKAHIITTSKPSDICAINELQMLKANKSIYFSSWELGEELKTHFTGMEATRPTTWHEVHVAVEDENFRDATHKRYKVIDLETETAGERDALIHVVTRYPQPSRWFSALRLRTQPKIFDTHTGQGILRPGSVAHASYLMRNYSMGSGS
ncbi:DUF4238 domain-containing protein [Kordiimonas sp.]|uniref:DUF4238 domain-containing protein n=1 Tax=Kordiimonas sp. TaxID=1970157 RepID=UPI003A8F909C